jgi:predicted secreted protein
MRIALLSTLLAISLAFPAHAEQDVIALPPAGHSILNLTVTEQMKLAQDTLSASLRYELDGGSANEIQDRINKAVAEAVAESKAYTGVKTTTGSYYVYVYDEGQIIDPRTGQAVSSSKKWRGTQTIELESEDSAKLLELAGKIQTKGFIMNGMNYSLSREKSESVQDELMQKALKQLGAKAKIAATALGKSGYDVIDININGSSPPVYPIYARASMMAMEKGVADVATPVAEAGESEVSLSLTARVLLKP